MSAWCSARRYTALVKTVSITEAKRKLSDLLSREQTVEITSRGTKVGTLRVFAQATRDPQRAQDAARRMRALSAKCTPSPLGGATKAVRDLRDSGD